MRPNVYITGLGAVSPAGWGMECLRSALHSGIPLPEVVFPRPGHRSQLKARLVPEQNAPAELTRHPRLRRASVLSLYAAAAALEAAGGTTAASADRGRLGVIACLQAGCVHYSCRFLEELLADPTTASPLIFPETVFGAPASHVAALLEASVRAETLVGDSASFLQGVAMGANWLVQGLVDRCLVVGAEECNTFLAEAFWPFEHGAILSNGAGALCLSNTPASPQSVALVRVTDPHPYVTPVTRASALRNLRTQLLGSPAATILYDGLTGGGRLDLPERQAWTDWAGPRISVKRVLGEGLMAAAAWQCVAACDDLAHGRHQQAWVSLAGSNQHALGAVFERMETP